MKYTNKKGINLVDKTYDRFIEVQKVLGCKSADAALTRLMDELGVK